MAVPAGDWLHLINYEYVRGYVADRGCAIKFVYGDDAVLEKLEADVRSIAKDRWLPVVKLDAASTKLHMMQDVFFAIACEVDWDRLAQKWVEAVFRKNNYEWPRPGEAVPLRELADVYQLNQTILRQEVLRWLARDLMNVRELHQDFRAAMASICMRRLEPLEEGGVPPVIEWLKGELRSIGAVRHVPINSKITRHNARAMLRSLCHWLRLVGGRGFVTIFDLRQVSRRAFGEGLKYTPSAAMDVFEVLRQLIDDAENFEGLLFLALADEQFVGDDVKRSLSAYPALKQRIYSEVRPDAHENPLMPLLAIASDDQPGLRRLPEKRLDGMMYTKQRVAIEALRAGVPNRTAVKLLGTAETALSARFRAALRALRYAASAREVRPREILSGGFGAGKSHLLEYLGEQALEEDFVVSKVIISKETPLFDTERVYAAAIRNAQAANANDDIMALALQRLRPGSQPYVDLEAWASEPGSGLSPMFAAILYLWQRQTLAPEDRVAIIRFLSGAKLGVARIRQWLRNSGGIGLVRLFDMRTVKAADLAQQRLRFAPALFRAAGFAGWCVLLDEVELIGRYSRLQRAKSYAELARWLGLSDDVAIPGLVSVPCIVSDFSDIMDAKRPPDEEEIPRVLAERGLDDAAQLATRAMRALRDQQYLLQPPTSETIRQSLEKVRELYAGSYGWPPPAGLVEPNITASDTMRHYIKSWITVWDIHRLYGDVTKVVIGDDPIDTTYEENSAFEQAAPGDVAEEEAM